MKTLTVGDLKARFSDVLLKVKGGEVFIVSFGKKKEKVALLTPYVELPSKARRIGLAKKEASFSFKGPFKISADELFPL